MAKKATSSTTSGAAGKGGAAGRGGAAGKSGAAAKAAPSGKGASAKPQASKSTAVARPVKARSSAQGSRGRSGAAGQGAQDSGFSASEALMKLIESPLMADLLTVAATAALAAIAGGRLRGAVDPDGRPSSAVRAAAKAALAAIGRRLAQEVDEIREAARKARDAATE